MGSGGIASPPTKAMTRSVWECLRRFIPGGPLGRAVALLAGGSALAQVISILAAPISTRLYSPEDYGTVAVFNALMGLIIIVASLRYELAIPLPGEDHRALDVVALCFGILTSTVVLTGAFVWFEADWLAGLMKNEALADWAWLLPIGVFGAGTYQVLNYWTLRRRRYKELAQTKFSQSILATFTMLSVGAIYGGPLGLILSAIVAQAAGILLLQRDARAVARTRQSPVTSAAVFSAAREYRQFPLYASGAALLNSLGGALPPLLLSSFYGEEVTGWFSLAYKVMLLPLSLVGIAVGQVFLGEAAEVVRDRPGELPGLFTRVTGRLMLLGLLIVAGGAVSPFAFPIIFGARWGPAGVYAACLSVFCAAQLVVSPISTVVIVRKRMGVQLTFDALRAVLVALALWLPAQLQLPGVVAVAAYSLAMLLTYGLYYVVYRKIALAPSETPARAGNLTLPQATA